MAWNEPGGNKDENKKPQDPWKQKPREQGPPDIDAVIKSLFAKLKGKKGGSSGPGGPSSSQNAGMSPNQWGMGLGILFLLYVLSGIYIVDPAEQAVVTCFGKYTRTENSGPHWYARFIEDYEIVDVQKVFSEQHEERMLTQDENIVWVEIAVQYQISDPKAYLFNAVEPRDSLKQAAESALRSVIGQSTLDQILTSGRAEIAEKIDDQLTQIIDSYNLGLVVSDVAMQPARAPNEVKEAFDDVIKAQEDEVREVNRAETYARKIEPIARGNAQRVIEEANAFKKQVVLVAQGDTARFNALLPEYRRAPEVTRQRLYLSAMSELLANTNKVLVEGNGNQLVYLPLDKLMEKTVAEAKAQVETPSSSPSNTSANTMQTNAASTNPSTIPSMKDMSAQNASKTRTRDYLSARERAREQLGGE